LLYQRGDEEDEDDDEEEGGLGDLHEDGLPEF